MILTIISHVLLEIIGMYE